MNLKEKLSKNKLGLSIGVFVLIGLLMVLGLIMTLRPKRRPELFPITGACQSYFEIETQADTNNVSQGDEVYIDIYLTTSGEPFEAAVALVEWDPNVFAYQNTTGALGSQFLSSFVAGNQGKRIMTHFAPRGDSPMQLGNGERVKFATLILRALVGNPNSEVRLSTN